MKYIGFLLGIIIWSSLFSQISTDTITTVAIQFINNKKLSFEEYKNIEFSIDKIYAIKSDTSQADYYIINLTPHGFIILSNEYSAVPVIAYSFNSSYSTEKQNPAFDWWMNHRAKEIRQLRKLKLSKNPQWEWYMHKHSVKSSKAVAPLVITKWDQGKFYNTMCPADPNGPDGHCVTGCVATAVSQLMYYHRWPLTGTGCHSYQHNVYGTIEACFDTCHYNYSAMTPSLLNYNYPAALLLYTTGISFDMVYGPNGSGVWNHSVANSMKAYFKYCPETRYIFRDSTSLNWDSLVTTNLDARKPLYYAGWEDTTFTSGHAFVCDGYQDSGYYHFNWGWGGYADGYFYSNQLNPAGSNFNICQELIVDIYPDTLQYAYPVYCHNDTLSHYTGTISTNYGTKTYLPNAQCSWLVAPLCGKTISMQFYTFNLASGDTVYIFDGENDQATLLQVFTQQQPPIIVGQTSPTTIKSSNNRVFVKFVTDNQNESYGFDLYYTTQYCNVDTLTSPSGIFSDGSGPCNYNDYTNCRWIIQPNGAQALKLTFTFFELASNNIGDYVSIYKNSIATNNLIAKYDALNTPTGPVYVPSGIAVVRFITNSAENAGGWEIEYEDATQLFPVISLNDTFIVFPNPVNANSTIESYQNIGEIKLYDVCGKCIVQGTFEKKSIAFNELTSHLSKGIYFLTIQQSMIKLIVTEDF